jgi:hypothetical protein
MPRGLALSTFGAKLKTLGDTSTRLPMEKLILQLLLEVIDRKAVWSKNSSV